MRLIILILATLYITGCAGPRFKFPSDIKGDCQHAKNQAKIHIEDCGTRLKKEVNLTVKKVKGTRKVGKGWAWEYKPGSWVYGTYYNRVIRVGCHPQTGGEVQYDTLHHECGHYWLVTNHGIGGHPVQYDKYFKWSWADRMTVRDGWTYFCVRGVDPDGNVYHINMVVDGKVEAKTMSWERAKSILESGEEWKK
jgi:hypothetical protein